MSQIHITKTPDTFARVPIDVLDYPGLSLAAKGLYAFLCAHNEDDVPLAQRLKELHNADPKMSAALDELVLNEAVGFQQ